jgi:site-specific DNA-methyltransferase (adenine-specific)
MLIENNIYLGDCLDLMPQIPDKSVDMILCDLPYEVTARQKWDVIIPFDKLWLNYNRIIKDNGAIVLFAIEPFRTKLIFSNPNHFKYDLIWRKNKVTGFLNAKKQPLRQHESILIFYKKQCCYNPQKTTGHKPVNTYRHKDGDRSLVYGKTAEFKGGGSTERYPTSILSFDVVNNDDPQRKHTAQKPLALCEHLIKTYTNENDLVLDNTMGSGTTCLAAKNLNRRFIGIEKEEKYFSIAQKRIFGDPIQVSS